MLRKKDSFQNITVHGQGTRSPRALMETRAGVGIIVASANTAATLQPVDRGVTLTFKSYYLSNTFPKVIAAMDSDPLMNVGKVP